MSHSSQEKLVKMANQIGQFFAGQNRVDQAAATAEHLSKFWDPRMRAAIVDHVENHGGAGLDPVALGAVRILAQHPTQHAPHAGHVGPGEGGADG
jgi:formate dehydrogenase subunit delta